MKVDCKINIFPKIKCFNFGYFSGELKENKLTSFKTQNTIKVLESKKNNFCFYLSKIILSLIFLVIAVYNGFQIKIPPIYLLILLGMWIGSTIIYTIVDFFKFSFELYLIIVFFLLNIISFFLFKYISLDLIVFNTYLFISMIFAGKALIEYLDEDEYLFFKTEDEKYIIKCKQIDKENK